MKPTNIVQTKTIDENNTCLFYHDGCFKLISPKEKDWMAEAITFESFKYLQTLPAEISDLKVKELIFSWLHKNLYLDKFQIIDLEHPVFEGRLNNSIISAIREYKINQILDDK